MRKWILILLVLTLCGARPLMADWYDGGQTATSRDIGTLTTDVSGLKTSTNNLNTRLTTEEGNVDSLQTSTNALNTRVGTAESGITSLNTSSNALNVRMGTAESGITSLNTSSNALNIRVGTLETTVQASTLSGEIPATVTYASVEFVGSNGTNMVLRHWFHTDGTNYIAASMKGSASTNLYPVPF